MHPHAAVVAGGIAAGLLSSLMAQTEAVDAGRLLCFTAVESRAGQRVDAIWCAELDAVGPPRRVWDGPGDAHVECRLDREHLLLGCRNGGLVAVDLATGARRAITDGIVTVVDVRGDEVLFVGDPRAVPPADQLRAAPWRGDGKARQLCEQRLRWVPCIRGAFAIGLGLDGRELLAVSLVSARARPLFTVPDDESSVTVALSPSGQLVAIGSVDRAGTGVLRVVEIGAARLVREWRDLPIDVSPLSSSTPTLEVGFADDAHVACSQTRGGPTPESGTFVHVQRDVASGEVTAEEPYAPKGLAHRPPGTPPVFEALFDVRRNAARAVLVLLQGERELAAVPMQREQSSDLAVSRLDGAFALARTGDDRHTLTLFASDGAPRVLSDCWCHDYVWLPAMP